MTRALQTRVVSYNVLSSHLARADYYRTLNPDHLEAANRLPVILKKLDPEVDRQSIICLQEVSYDWAGSFHTYFANRGYHFVTGLYGKKFNGYMGCGIAFPLATSEVVKVDVSRLSDKRKDGWPRPPKPGFLGKSVNQILGMGRGVLQALGVLGRPQQDHWTMAENRFNVMVSVQLQDKASGKKYMVSTYHMPCAFYAPMVMTLHCDLAAQHVQSLAASSSSENCPYILAGDWNIKPYDSSYQLLTTGKMDVGDAISWPTPKHGMTWEPSAKPMKSAYAESPHGEPDFTNFARVKEQEPFIDTLDYIFCSEDDWKVDGVLPLPKREDAKGPFPNLDVAEPSDHIMIAADLSLRA